MSIGDFSNWYNTHKEHFNSRNMTVKEIAHEAWLAAVENHLTQTTPVNRICWHCKKPEVPVCAICGCAIFY